MVYRNTILLFYKRNFNQNISRNAPNTFQIIIYNLLLLIYKSNGSFNSLILPQKVSFHNRLLGSSNILEVQGGNDSLTIEETNSDITLDQVVILYGLLINGYWYSIVHGTKYGFVDCDVIIIDGVPGNFNTILHFVFPVFFLLLVKLFIIDYSKKIKKSN